LRKTACFFALVKWRSTWRKKAKKRYTRGTGGARPRPSSPPARPAPRPESPGPHAAEAAVSDAQAAKALQLGHYQLGNSAVYMGCMPHLSPACRRLAGLEPQSRQYGTRA
jgi:hypothetical protein